MLVARKRDHVTWSEDSFIGSDENPGPLNRDGLLSFRNRLGGPMKEKIEELEGFRLLHANWDGEGAEKPKRELVDSAIALLTNLPDVGWIFSGRELPPPSRVTATQIGNIVLEWQFNDGYYLEAEVSEPSRVEWMFEDPIRPTKHWVLDLSGTPNGQRSRPYAV